MNGYGHIVRVSVLGLIFLEVAFGQHYTDKWAVHVLGGERKARSVADKYGFIYRGQIMTDYYHFQHRKVAKRSTYPSSFYHRNLASDPNVRWIEQQKAKLRVKRQPFNDPKWGIMWYLNRGAGLDMNVRKAWDYGFTGKGVTVTILDDGIEKDHPDLKVNYDERASYDVNGHDPDPQPRYDYSNENRHGTRCAGEVAAQADNNVCSVGVAYGANIGGVRMLDGDVTDSVEAQSLSLNPQYIHIYSASWGPDDDGRTVDGPATLARKAFYDGITKGRGGLGSIFVWASGNGGRDGDNCNCDGYTNSIYTLSISSATENGKIPWYSEACSSTLATTYSSGSGGEKQIVTTDLRNGCTENHTGTSASAPLAAGIIALALEANPHLTWRDMQHLVVETAKPDHLISHDWVVNGIGKRVSHSFGFGLMDAAAMVRRASNWTTVPAQHICEIRSTVTNRQVPMNGRIMVPLVTDGCVGNGNPVKFLEHVQARITMSSNRRGELQIFLTSPQGTRSTLLAKRTRDSSREGFNNWAFMTTHNWGEYANGTWTLEIENGASSFRAVRLRDWVLVLYGTDSHPWKKQHPPPRPPKAITSTQASVTNHFSYMRTQSPYRRMSHRPSTPKPRITTTPELKEWTMVVMGTGAHPLKQNVTPYPKYKPPFTCAGVTSHGVCTECKPGYFKMSDTCVAHCPQHYFGSVEAVRLAPILPNSSKPLSSKQGLCKPCHESCLTCKGALPDDCYQCNNGFERKNDLCEKKMIWDFLDPDVMKHLAWAIMLCIGGILLFSVVFGILQARDQSKLCWRVKRYYVPDFSKGRYNGVSSDFTGEDAEVGAYYSRTPRVIQLPKA
ncbi:furin-like protease kpc-1 isoform X1 [Haliotis asinina]|uniref:furin-like protease kpc-1 isoform X1 n=1 Tax=Haliotis asinina TaxID=109174 RepID=UPI003531BAD9